MSSMNLYVGNLPYSLSESELADLFNPYGEVLSAKVITDRVTGQSRGFGFVEMASRAEGEEAVNALNGTEVNRRQLRVNEAKPRPQGGGRRGGAFERRREEDRY